VDSKDPKVQVVCTCDYNIEFPALIAHKNIYASQFHPEKSGLMGLRMLENFIENIKVN
jgi:glutamine amidotransferase